MARVSRVHLDALVDAPGVRVSQVHLDSLVKPTGVRISQIHLDVLVLPTPTVRTVGGTSPVKVLHPNGEWHALGVSP